MQLNDSFWSWLYFAGMAIVVLSLPFLNLGMSIGGFWLAGAWILHTVYLAISSEDKLQNIRKIQESKVALALIGLFLLHIAGLIHTEDLNYAFKDLRIKLPMLFMPLVFTAIPKFGKSKRRLIELLFILACMVASIFILIRAEWSGAPVGFRKAHFFISHIRFGLMAAFAAFLSIRLLLTSRLRSKWLYSIPVVIFIVYFIHLQSLTGIITFLAALAVGGVVYVMRMKKGFTRTSVGIALIALIVVPSAYISFSAYNYFNHPVPEKGTLPEQTANGKPYFHKWGDSQIENGNLIWYYICWDELAAGWNERSSIPYRGEDKLGRNLNGTLIRYLTSKGLQKDFSGIDQLSDDDIRNIENGITSFKDLDRKGLRKRIHALFFELNAYFNGGNPTGNSLTQRFEFWRAGKHILSEKWLIGVGTGDVPRAFKRAYEEIDTKLSPETRHRSHNQYMSLFIALGIPGLLWFFVVLGGPFLWNRKAALNTRYIAFITILGLSFLTEDTLESQVGQTLFTFFYSYLVVLKMHESSEDEGTDHFRGDV